MNQNSELRQSNSVKRLPSKYLCSFMHNRYKFEKNGSLSDPKVSVNSTITDSMM